ncbi:hypothetical protein [Erythrobacter sp. JK5]|uniref:hypothetical protein n=1 Tax=Erythrobacter sp. JK5 TaxID=2829500 RepID=UPI001BA7261E|nr:hypothetical protein [Erythrobacter sp. JK5]QUL38433.1 hypothetical protein KDC96_03200 [Erythrobacter sp. JK5]
MLPAEAFIMSSLEVRVDNTTASLSSKTSENQNLAVCFSNLSSPEDRLRLLRDAESRKLRNPDFSTFAQIICGERWTTQRFTAFVEIVADWPVQPSTNRHNFLRPRRPHGLLDS